MLSRYEVRGARCEIILFAFHLAILTPRTTYLVPRIFHLAILAPPYLRTSVPPTTRLRQFQMSDAGELVVDLLLLHLQLCLVGQILPFATAADAKMLASGYRAYITILDEALHLSLGEAVLLARQLHVDDVARHAEGHKDDKVVPVEQRLPLGGTSLDGDILYQWQWFLFPAHNRTYFMNLRAKVAKKTDFLSLFQIKPLNLQANIV